MDGAIRLSLKSCGELTFCVDGKFSLTGIPFSQPMDFQGGSTTAVHSCCGIDQKTTCLYHDFKHLSESPLSTDWLLLCHSVYSVVCVLLL